MRVIPPVRKLCSTFNDFYLFHTNYASAFNAISCTRWFMQISGWIDDCDFGQAILDKLTIAHRITVKLAVHLQHPDGIKSVDVPTLWWQYSRIALHIQVGCTAASDRIAATASQAT